MSIYSQGDYDANFMEYSGNKQVLTFNAQTQTMTEYIDNPVIVLDMNSDTSESHVDEADMWYLDDEVINLLCDEYGLNRLVLRETAVEDMYNYSFKVIVSEIITLFVMSLLMVALNLVIVSSSMKVYFNLNSVENSIKKTLGYRSLSRYISIIVVSIATNLIGYGISVYVLEKLDFENIRSTASIFVLALCVLDLIYLVYNIKKLERANISKILKGGAL